MGMRCIKTPARWVVGANSWLYGWGCSMNPFDDAYRMSVEDAKRLLLGVALGFVLGCGVLWVAV